MERFGRHLDPNKKQRGVGLPTLWITFFWQKSYKCIQKGSFGEVASGAPDLSVSEAECETYAASVGATWLGVERNWGGYPTGCHTESATDIGYKQTNHDAMCSNDYMCIQKADTSCGFYEVSSGQKNTSCLQLPSVVSLTQYGAPVQRVTLPWVVEDTKEE